MAKLKYHAVLALLRDREGWSVEKVKAFDEYCRKKGLIADERIEDGATPDAVKAFEETYAG